MAGNEGKRGATAPTLPTFTPPAGAVPLHGRGETFKWDQPGKTLEGLYCGMDPGSKGGQMVAIQTPTGKEVASAPLPLQKALRGISVGTRVLIRYLGEEPLKSGKLGEDGKAQRVKTFEVYGIPSQAGAR